jgi:CelD/BcsL family acetyltransferase involved in cellulose biosynthesis
MALLERGLEWRRSDSGATLAKAPWLIVEGALRGVAIAGRESVMPSRIEEWSFSTCDAGLLREWGELLAEAGEPSVFLSHEWLRPWWRAFGDGLRPLLIVGRGPGGELTGLAPLYSIRQTVAGLPGPRVICSMGDRSVGSEYLGFLIRAGEEEAFLSALAEHLKGKWALLDFLGMREDGRVAALLPALLGPTPLRRIHREHHPCSAIHLPTDYETFVSSLSSRFKAQLVSSTRKLEKRHQVRLVRTTKSDELAGHLERLFALHEARWAATGRRGCFSDRRMRSFYDEMSRAFLRRGWLRFYHLEVDGQIRACQFGFVFGDRFHSLQEAFDHSVEAAGIRGLGVILRGRVIRECIAEGVRIYDFLGGDEDFKQRWGTTTHYVQRLRIAAPGAAGALAFTSTARVRMVKDWGLANLPKALFVTRDRWWSWHRSRRARRFNHGSEGKHL